MNQVQIPLRPQNGWSPGWESPLWSTPTSGVTGTTHHHPLVHWGPSVHLWFNAHLSTCVAGEVQLTNKDPRWVGAWWLGFLVAASLVALSAVPYFFFPQEMPKEVGEVLQITFLALHTNTWCIHMRVPCSPPAPAATSVGNVTVEVVVQFI